MKSADNTQQDVTRVIAEHRPILKNFIRKRVSNTEDADDILQDVFYQLVKAYDQSVNPIKQVSAWLFRVARNLIINKETKMHEEEMPTYRNDEGEDVLKDFSEILFGSEASPSPETEYLRSLVWTELEDALAELPDEQREMFELTELEGLPVKEISEATGVPVNTLLSRKRYAVLHLRKRLASLYEAIIYA